MLETAGTVVLIGAGKMGSAMVHGWLAGGLPAKNMVLVDPNPSEQVSNFAKANGLALLDKAPIEAPRALVLAVKPQVMGDVMGLVRGSIGPQTLVLSVAAGIGIATMENGLGTNRIVRTIPNTPAQIGKGISGATAGAGVDADDRVLADALLAAAGQVIWFEDEGLINAVTAVSGSGPAYVFNMVEAMAKAGEAQGLSAADAMALARQTVIGAAALMEADPSPAAVLRQNVTSPNGTTAAALAHLMADDGLVPLMTRAVEAARKRGEELGK